MADDLRHRYAEALAATHTLDETDLQFTLHLVLDLREEEMAKLRWERDLAIAHDRQPYPTAWAYEQACKALNSWRERAENAESANGRARALHPSAGEAQAAKQALCVECAQPAPCKTRQALDDTPEA